MLLNYLLGKKLPYILLYVGWIVQRAQRSTSSQRCFKLSLLDRGKFFSCFFLKYFFVINSLTTTTDMSAMKIKLCSKLSLPQNLR